MNSNFLNAEFWNGFVHASPTERCSMDCFEDLHFFMLMPEKLNLFQVKCPRRESLCVLLKGDLNAG